MRVLGYVLVLCLAIAVPSWAISADQLVRHFEENQNWTKSAMASFKVQKKASDPRIADMYEFVSDKSYDFEGLIIDGSEYGRWSNGAMKGLLRIIGDGVFSVIHKLATDDHKKIFKPTWLGFHSPQDKRVSNWFCLIMGNHTRTYLTRVDQRSKLDEIGADPLQMNILDKNLFDFTLVKDLGNRAILKVTPRPQAHANFREGLVELAQLKVGNAETWYVTKITGSLKNGANGETQFGNFRVIAAKPGEYIGWSNAGKQIGSKPSWGIGAAQDQSVAPDQKLFVFATQLQTTTRQSSRDIKDYEISLLTNIQHLHINPPMDTMAAYINSARLKTLEKAARKIVDSH